MAAVEAIAFSEIEALVESHPMIIAYALTESGLGTVSAAVPRGDHGFWSHALGTAARVGPQRVQGMRIAGVELRVLLSPGTNFVVLGRGPWTLSLAVPGEAPLGAVVEDALDHFLAAIAAFDGLLPGVGSHEGR